MKKFSFICFCLFLLGGFVFAKEGERRDINKPEIIQQKTGNYSINSSHKKTLEQKIQEIQKKPKATIADLCFGGKEIAIRDNLSQKTKESSDKIFGLIDLASKIGYETKNLEFLAEELHTLSSHITEICSLSDLNKHREKTKITLSSLRKEIALLKKYITILRKK